MPGPSKSAETIVGIFVPPACREEVLGDLHERFRSPLQYAFEAFLTVPLVIGSRIRRTSDPQIVLIQAFALYLSFLGAAWFLDGALLHSEMGLIRLAIPPALAVFGVMLDDAYTRPGHRPSAYRLARGPLLGAALALLTQAVGPPLPIWIMLSGCGMGLLLSSAIRMLFPPAADQLQGANAPAYWLQRSGDDDGGGIISQIITRTLKVLAAVLSVGVVGALLSERTELPMPAVMTVLALLVVGYELSRRS